MPVSGRVVAEGLGFVEGPVAMADGSVIVVSLSRGELLRVHPDGSHDVIAKPGGSPNGAALGPDGRHAHLTKVVIDRGVRIPEGLIVGEDPEEDARRFRRTENGVCLITQPMIDKLH